MYSNSQPVEDDVVDLLVGEIFKGKKSGPQLRAALQQLGLEIVSKQRAEQEWNHQSKEIETLQIKCIELDENNRTLQTNLAKSQIEKERMSQTENRFKVFIEQLGKIIEFPVQKRTNLLENKILDEIMTHIKNILEIRNREREDVRRNKEIIKRIEGLLQQAQGAASAISGELQFSTSLVSEAATPSPSPSVNLTTPAPSTITALLKVDPHTAMPPNDELFITIPENAPIEEKFIANLSTPPLPRIQTGNPTFSSSNKNKIADFIAMEPVVNHLDSRAPPTTTPDSEFEQKIEDMKLFGGRVTPPIPRHGNSTVPIPVKSVAETPIIPVSSQKRIRETIQNPYPSLEIYQVTPRDPPPVETKIFQTPLSPSFHGGIATSLPIQPTPSSSTTAANSLLPQSPLPNQPKHSNSGSLTPKSSSLNKRFGIKISPAPPPPPLPAVDLTYEMEMADIEIDSPSNPSVSPTQEGPSIVIPTQGTTVNLSTNSDPGFPKHGWAKLNQQRITPPVVETTEDDHVQHARDKSCTGTHDCICGKTYVFRNGLQSHIRKMTQEWKFKCGSCNLYFFYEYEYRRHSCYKKICSTTAAPTASKERRKDGHS